MKIVTSPKRMQEICRDIKQKGKLIGFVPTMGYLHQGHISLVRIAKRKSDVLIVSIFVNPTQFGPKEDFKRYPRDFNGDKNLLKKERCNFIFAPKIEDIYPKDYSTHIEIKNLIGRLEGVSRPGHFKGVATIVAKLFNIINPHIAVFGQKDFQQAVVIKKMVQDLNFRTKIIVGPTIREKNGLALSSRNRYLSLKERKSAMVLYKSLILAKKLIKKRERDTKRIITKMRNLIKKEKKAKIDYIAITDAQNLKPMDKIKGEVLISLAVKIGRIRLIDNVKIKM